MRQVRGEPVRVVRVCVRRERFIWKVTVHDRRLSWFRCGAGASQCGRDPHLTIARADDLACRLRKLAPAHTQLLFDYDPSA